MNRFLVVLLVAAVFCGIEAKNRYKRQSEKCDDCENFCNCLPEPMNPLKIPPVHKAAAIAMRDCEKEDEAKWEKFEQCMVKKTGDDEYVEIELCPGCQKMKALEDIENYYDLRRKRSANKRRKREAEVGSDEWSDFGYDEYSECMEGKGIKKPDIKKFVKFLEQEDTKREEDDYKLWDAVDKCGTDFCGEDESFEQTCALEAGLDPDLFDYGSYSDEFQEDES